MRRRGAPPYLGYQLTFNLAENLFDRRGRRHIKSLIDNSAQPLSTVEQAFGNNFTVARLDSQSAIYEFIALITGDALHDEHACKRHERVGGRVPVTELVVRMKLRRQVEDVHGPPAVRLLGGQCRLAAFAGSFERRDG